MRVLAGKMAATMISAAAALNVSIQTHLARLLLLRAHYVHVQLAEDFKKKFDTCIAGTVRQLAMDGAR